MNPYLIDDAADLLLDCGVKLSETREGKAVLEMAREYAKLQEARIRGPKMPVGEFVARKEDMSQEGRLRLFKEQDGDICVSVIEDDGNMAGIQFCTVGMGEASPARRWRPSTPWPWPCKKTTRSSPVGPPSDKWGRNAPWMIKPKFNVQCLLAGKSSPTAPRGVGAFPGEVSRLRYHRHEAPPVRLGHGPAPGQSRSRLCWPELEGGPSQCGGRRSPGRHGLTNKKVSVSWD